MTEKQANTEVEPYDPVKRITSIALIIIAVVFIWYVIADRLAPWTDQARVQAYIVPVVSQVAGQVIEINVSKDQEVQEGDVLLRINPSDYQLAVDNAETELELAGQTIGASTASVSTAQAKVTEAQVHVAYIRAQSKRVFELEAKQIYSVSRGDKARAAVVKAKAQLASAKSELEKAKQELGVTGNENPKIRSAIAKLKKAQIDLSRTIILAPSHGGITNLKIDEGYYASVGAPLMTFIEIDNVWIKANLRENSMANIEVGTPVDFILDSAPGMVFQGSVSSLGFAVSHEKGGAVGDLESIESSSGWLRDAQRFPVYVTFDVEPTRGLLRLGGQADVQFYSTGNWLINSIGWVWIRVLSWFSYIY
jgi:multidrug resistance efflux pump